MIILTDTANIQNNNGHELTIPVKKCIIYIITIMEKSYPHGHCKYIKTITGMQQTHPLKTYNLNHNNYEEVILTYISNIINVLNIYK